MTPLSTNSSLAAIDLTDTTVCNWIAAMLPAVGVSHCVEGTAPLELVKETAEKMRAGTVADLVLELTIALTGGGFAQSIEIDTSAVTPIADVLATEQLHWAQLEVYLSRPDWTVAVNLRALPDLSEPPSQGDGVVAVLVRAGLDLHDWLAEGRTRAMLHAWYVQYQASGTLPSDRHLAELP